MTSHSTAHAAGQHLDRQRPAHLRWRYLAFVAAGGAVGTGLRQTLTLLIPTVAGFPIGTLIINTTGALLLGVLLTVLTRRGPDEGRRRALRLLFGTGLLGGFTTYSTLSVETATLFAGGNPAQSVLYALGTLLLGGLASWAGILLGTIERSKKRQERGHEQ